MKKVLLLVEGQTEERFVKDVLGPHMLQREIVSVPVLVTTKLVKAGADFKGGISTYAKLEKDLMRLLGDTSAMAVTTLVDYYGLPEDFPGMKSRPGGDALARASYVETSWASHVSHHRFHPHLMVHEFEALLFSETTQLAVALHEPGRATDLAQIRKSFPTPEDINEGPETTPAKRIRALFPGYQKALHGPLVAGRIGLDVIRTCCRHFDDWLSWIEKL